MLRRRVFWPHRAGPAVLAAVAALTLVGSTRDSGAALRRSDAKAQLFLAPSGSDSNPCSQAAPCLSLQHAYDRARPGQTVQLAGGTYPSGQTLAYDAQRAGIRRHVTFRAAPRADVVIDNLDIRGAQHLTFDGIDFTHDVGIVYANVDDPGGPVASDIVIHGGRMQTFHIISAKNITIDGVDIGHYYYSDGFSSNWVATHEGFPSSRNILIENSTFQGIRRGRTPAAGAGIHAECLFTQRVNGLTVRGNKFIGCPIYSLAFYDATTGPGADSNSARNILIENNFISCGNEVDPCADAVDFATKGYETIANVTVRFNSSNDAFNFDGSAPLFRNNRAYGNVAQHVDCETSGWAQSYNVVAAGSCGGTNRHAPSGFVTSSWQGDFHVVRGAPALGAVPLRFCRKYGCPSADIDGDPRPLRAGADAGADQRDPAAIIFAKGIGAVALGQSKTQVDATYGRARWVRSLRTNRRTSPLQVFSYRPHGRTLWVVYDGDRATGVGTPSVYYTTRGGLGPGVAIPRAQAAAFRLTCRGTYRRAAGSAVASITRAGRSPNWRVGTIWVYSASLARSLGCSPPRP